MDSWKKYELQEIISLSKEKYNPKKDKESFKCVELEHLESGTGRLLGYTDSLNQQSVKNKFNPGNVLFGKLRPYLKKYYLPDFEGVCSSEIWVLKGNEEKISSTYLFYLIQSNRFLQNANKSAGSKMPRADWGYLSEVIFSIPSLREQDEIASILLTWDRAIELKEKLVNQKKKQKKGLMQRLLTGEVRLHGYEEEWKSIELKDAIARVIDNRGKTPPLSSEGFELIEVNALESNNKNPNYKKVAKYVSEETYNSWFRNGHPQKGDILVATVGSVGSTVIMNENRGCIAQNIIALNIKDEYNADYIYYWMNSSIYLNLIKKVLMGAVQPSLKVPHLLQFKLTIPKIEEQEKIAEILSSYDNTINLLTQEINNLKLQKKALMQQLLTGKIRVKV
ncbi:restriction endonuclease subunit S [Lysinibacillus telephonicus]|uniref:restriction endonuclease subunit S n=1 Tax=Lysinibacillus telephonicus TaxID=1714840 RepID=UPI0031FC4C52